MTIKDKWDLLNADCESPQSFLDWGFISMINAALQRRVWVGEHEYRLYPGMFNMMVAPPGVGKSRVISTICGCLVRVIRPLHNGAGFEPAIILGGDSTSKEATLDQLYECEQFYPTGRVINGIPEYYTYRAVTFLCEEFGVLMNSQDVDRANQFNQLYDGRSFLINYKNSGGKRLIENVNVNIIAGSNPDFVADCLKTNIINQGFLSRFIVCVEMEPRFNRLFRGFTPEQNQAREDIIKHLNRLQTVYGQLNYSPEAYEFIREIHESGRLKNQRVNKSVHLEHYYARKLSHMLKVAMGIHFSDANIPNTIQLSSVTTALDMLNKLEPNMGKLFENVGLNPVLPIINRVRKLILPGKPLSRKQLLAHTVDLGQVHMIDEAVAHLKAIGEVIEIAQGLMLAKSNQSLVGVGHSPSTNGIDTHVNGVIVDGHEHQSRVSHLPRI